MPAWQLHAFSFVHAWPAGLRFTDCQGEHSQSCSTCMCIFRGVEKALDQSLTPPVQAEVSEEAAPAGGEEANGPTPEEIAEAEAKVLTSCLQKTRQC